jgi:hypothetical protein
MPEALYGEWCWKPGGDELNWQRQVFIRSAPKKPCHIHDGIIIEIVGWSNDEGTVCRANKSEQKGPKFWQMDVTCGQSIDEVDDHGIATFEIVDNELILTWLPEG